jgi:hypothetical protein
MGSKALYHEQAFNQEYFDWKSLNPEDFWKENDIIGQISS